MRRSACLLYHGVYFIFVIHFKISRRLVATNALPIEEEAHGVRIRTDLLAVCLHHFAKRCCFLYFKNTPHLYN